MNIALFIILFLGSFVLLSGRNIKTLDKERTYSVRGLLALFIVLCHCAFINSNTLWDISAFRYVGAWVCGIFFLMSGFGLYAQKHYIKEQTITFYLKKRVLPLFVDLIILSIGFNIFALFTGYRNLADISNIFASFDLNNILPYSWYIYMIIYMYILAYFTFRSDNPIAVTIIITIVTVFVLKFSSVNICWYNSILAFPTGMLVYKYKSLFQSKKAIGSLSLISLICISTYLLTGNPNLEILTTPPHFFNNYYIAREFA